LNAVRSTIVIATTAEAKRTSQLQRAIASCLAQENTSVKIIVVVNGNIYSEDLNKWLSSHESIDYYYLPIGDFPNAIYFGRQQVKTDFFAFLDDDDELTSNSVWLRENILINNEEVDVVVGNGVRVCSESQLQTKVIPDVTLLHNSTGLLDTLVFSGVNWLASCGGLYRSDRITNDFFKDYARHIEWTYFAFKLAIRNNVVIIDDACYRINSTSGSLSKKMSYVTGIYNSTSQILKLELPAEYKKTMQQKKFSAAHYAAVVTLEQGLLMESFNFYISCLGSVRSFLKYFLFSRKYFYYCLKNIDKL
jgi:hypothetical protein